MVIVKKPGVNVPLAQRGLYGRKIHGQITILNNGSDLSESGQDTKQEIRDFTSCTFVSFVVQSADLFGAQPGRWQASGSCRKSTRAPAVATPTAVTAHHMRPGWCVDLAEVMNQFSSKPASDERADSDRQKSESHVCALLAGRRQAGNVFVVARRLDDLAQRNRNEGKHCHRDRGMRDQNQPRPGPRSVFPA